MNKRLMERSHKQRKVGNEKAGLTFTCDQQRDDKYGCSTLIMEQDQQVGVSQYEYTWSMKLTLLLWWLVEWWQAKLGVDGRLRTQMSAQRRNRKNMNLHCKQSKCGKCIAYHVHAMHLVGNRNFHKFGTADSTWSKPIHLICYFHSKFWRYLPSKSTKRWSYTIPRHTRHDEDVFVIYFRAYIIFVPPLI